MRSREFRLHCIRERHKNREVTRGSRSAGQEENARGGHLEVNPRIINWRIRRSAKREEVLTGRTDPSASVRVSSNR
jgi:hypothetical protein